MRKNITTLSLLLAFAFSAPDMLSWFLRDWSPVAMDVREHQRSAPEPAVKAGHPTKPGPNKSHLTIPGSSPDGNG